VDADVQEEKGADGDDVKSRPWRPPEKDGRNEEQSVRGDGQAAVPHPGLPFGKRRQRRCRHGAPSSGITGSARKKFRVIPDILVILGQKEPPTRRETEVGKHGRQ
jgi:hypothetical protein